MSGPLQIALGEGSWDAHYLSMLVVRMLTIYFQYSANFQQKLSKGLNEVHPFSIQLQSTLFTMKQRKFCPQNLLQSV